MKKTVLITGASRGIGRECAIAFSKNGYNVVANYLNSEEQAFKLAKEYDNIMPFRADVSDVNQVKTMTEQAIHKFGGIDVLINNAGVALQKLFTDTSDEEWKRIFDINVGGVFNCTREIVKHMISKHDGKIINISSMWGECGASCEVAYSASKAAIIGFTKALAKELGPSGITVNCISPGLINTEMNSNLDKETVDGIVEETPLQMVGECRHIAEAALFLASSSSEFITGQVIGVNGGFLI